MFNNLKIKTVNFLNNFKMAKKRKNNNFHNVGSDTRTKNNSKSTSNVGKQKQIGFHHKNTIPVNARLEEFTLKKNAKIVIDPLVWVKLHWLHTKENVEWSGALYYTFEGTLSNPESIKIRIIDFLLMDIGSSAYTEYDIDENVANKLFDLYDKCNSDDNQENETVIKIGHLHTHHSMDVFFSGTDSAELHDNAPNHDFYLSTIINKKGDVCSKIAFEAKITNSDKFENSILAIINCTHEIETHSVTINTEVNINQRFMSKPVKVDISQAIEKEFIDRYEEIKKSSNTYASKMATTYNTKITPGVNAGNTRFGNNNRNLPTHGLTIPNPHLPNSSYDEFEIDEHWKAMTEGAYTDDNDFAISQANKAFDKIDKEEDNTHMEHMLDLYSDDLEMVLPGLFCGDVDESIRNLENELSGHEYLLNKETSDDTQHVSKELDEMLETDNLITALAESFNLDLADFDVNSLYTLISDYMIANYNEEYPRITKFFNDKLKVAMSKEEIFQFMNEAEQETKVMTNTRTFTD